MVFYPYSEIWSRGLSLRFFEYTQDAKKKAQINFLSNASEILIAVCG